MPQDDKTRAKALIDKYRGNVYGGQVLGINTDGLCDAMSKIVMRQPLTVVEVFNVLIERHYSQAELEAIAINLMRRINPTNLIELAKSKGGIILLQGIRSLMKCGESSIEPLCQRINTAYQRANDKMREEEQKQPNDTGQPRQLSEVEIAFFIERGQNQKLWMRKGKLVSRKLFDPTIVWDLPIEGAGFNTYRIDDLKRPELGDSKYGYDQIGTKETVEAMIEIAKQWSVSHSDRKMQYGDMSRPGGINTPDHGTHKNGKTFDICPLRNDTQLSGLELDLKGYHPNYDRKLTKECMQLIIKLYPVTLIYFNDPVILSDPDLNKVVQRSDKTHYNHFHVELQ